MKIYVKNNDINKALRVLKKKLLIEGDAKAHRQHEHFISDSQQRRIDEKAGRKRWLKKREKIEQNRVKAEQAAIYANKKKKASNNRNNLVA